DYLTSIWLSDLEDIPKIFNGGDNTCSRDDMSVLEELKVAEFAGDPLNDDPAQFEAIIMDTFFLILRPLEITKALIQFSRNSIF
ncbi:MAG: hypothetical protein EZS28_048791, partial [Streblomastix strix]